jgi:hypothetical protein
MLFFLATTIPLVIWILSVHLLSRRRHFARFFAFNLFIFTGYTLFLLLAGARYFDFGGYGLGFFLYQYIFMVMHILVVFAIALYEKWRHPL